MSLNLCAEEVVELDADQDEDVFDFETFMKDGRGFGLSWRNIVNRKNEI